MCVMTLSVKQEVKITFVKSRLITLQSIIYQPEGKNLLHRTSTIILSFLVYSLTFVCFFSQADFFSRLSHEANRI